MYDDLIHEFKGGDERAYSELIRLLRKPLYSVLRPGLQSHIAEDLFHGVIVRLYLSSAFDPTRSFWPYIFLVARHVRADYFRQLRREGGIQLEAVEGWQDMYNDKGDQANVLQQSLIFEDQMAMLEEAVPKILSSKLREVYDLRYSAGLAIENVARDLSISITAVKSRIRSINKKLDEYFVEQKARPADEDYATKTA